VDIYTYYFLLTRGRPFVLPLLLIAPSSARITYNWRGRTPLTSVLHRALHIIPSDHSTRFGSYPDRGVRERAGSADFLEEFFSVTTELVKLDVWGRTGFDVSGQRPVRRAEFAGDSLNAGN
jgi:hypothetical protein